MTTLALLWEMSLQFAERLQGDQSCSVYQYSASSAYLQSLPPRAGNADSSASSDGTSDDSESEDKEDGSGVQNQQVDGSGKHVAAPSEFGDADLDLLASLKAAGLLLSGLLPLS